MRPPNGHQTSEQEQYKPFAKELTQRFEQTYAESQPPVSATIVPLPGRDDVEITIRAMGQRLVVEQFLVVYVVPGSLEIAWEMIQGAVDGARAKARVA